MDETRNSVKDPTEVKNALAKYLELFTSHSNFFKFFIAQNGVLEWFGRSIKGNTKIHDYLRYEVCSQYDHLFFENAEPCEPFECKSTHMETKSLPTQSDKNLNNSSFDLDKTNPIEEDVSMSTDVVEFTTTKDRRGSITPPSSAKRVKLDQDLNRSISPPMLNVDDYFEKKETNVKLIVPRSSRNCFETPDSTYVSTAATTSSQVQYSELKYFEAIGILRSCLQPEHKNFRLSNTLNANGSWDRETKIQISYRIRLDDNDVQFALIIYKNLHSYSALSKRNLMSEFDEVATHKRLAAEEKNKNGSTSSTKSTTTTKSQKEKRKIGRRLRLF